MRHLFFGDREIFRSLRPQAPRAGTPWARGLAGALLVLCAGLGCSSGGGSAPPAAVRRPEAAAPAPGITRYSISLMWINRTLDPGQAYLAPARDAHELVGKLLEPALKWAEANPTARVDLWYDSAQATPAALETTQGLLRERAAARKVSNLQLRDLRSIAIVAGNPDSFSDQLPVYFRVDVLKAVLLVNAIEHDGMDAAVFADLEVGDLRPGGTRMGKAELFDAEALGMLARQGLILNRVAARKENQFLQIRKDERMVTALKRAVVNVNLLRAVTGLNSGEDLFLVGLARSPFLSTISDVFRYYFGTAPGARIQVNPRIVNRGRSTDPWIDYDPKAHGYAPFGLHFSNRDSLGLEPDPDRPGAWLAMNDMLRFPAEATGHPPQGRDVAVRAGSDHGGVTFQEVRRPPAGGGTTFHCVLWD